MDARVGPDDEQLYVAMAEFERGTDGPFYVTYVDAEATRRWGYFCGNCESFATAMDSMGRIKCTDCQNLRKPDEWDAAHE